MPDAGADAWAYVPTTGVSSSTAGAIAGLNTVRN